MWRGFDSLRRIIEELTIKNVMQDKQARENYKRFADLKCNRKCIVKIQNNYGYIFHKDSEGGAKVTSREYSLKSLTCVIGSSSTA